MRKEKLDPRQSDFACNHVSIEMEYPRTGTDIEAFLFYLYHERIEVFIDSYSGWHVLARGRCSQLSPKNACRISNRQADECLQHGEDGGSIEEVAKFHFRNEYELVTYIRERRPALFKKLHPNTQKVADLPKPPKKSKPETGFVLVTQPTGSIERLDQAYRSFADVSPKSWLDNGKNAKIPTSNELDEDHKCFDCNSCCTYLNIIVDKPNKEDYINALLWYINHAGCELYLDKDRDWSVLFRGRCRQLDSNGLCGIYDRRPSICRRFPSDQCHGYDVVETVKEYFASERQLMSYLSRQRPGLFNKLRPELKELAGKGK